MAWRKLVLAALVALTVVAFLGWLFLSADPETNGEAETLGVPATPAN
jgi:hypothetical protein